MPSWHNLTKLSCTIRHFNRQSLRWYRFGHRVVPRGYYDTTKIETDRQLLMKKTPEDVRRINSEELRKRRNAIFDEEKQRQKDLVARIEKIEVEVKEIPVSVNDTPTVTLLMNKNISTPFNCAQHIHQLLTKRSVIAEVNGKTFWDMHRPLQADCQLRFRHFKEKENAAVNKAFWRSCSFLLGMVIEKAFKEEVEVYLHSWPQPDPASGSFVYDVVLNVNNWKPKGSELRVFSLMLNKVIKRELIFERLEVRPDLAMQIFEHNKIKCEQIENMTKTVDRETVPLYRLEDHIDISVGPMISNTSQIGIIHASAVHPINTSLGVLYRFQGISLPQQLSLTPFTFNIIKEKSRRLNMSGLDKLLKEKTGKSNPEDNKISLDENANRTEDENHEKTQKIIEMKM